MSDITDETSEFILDPEGEVTIILHDPDAPFAVWDLTAASRHHDPCNSKVVDWTSAAARNATKNPGLVHAMALARRIAEPSEATAQVSSEANLFESETEDGREQEQPGEDAPGDNEKKALGEESTTPEPAPVRFRVSAKHLMLASPVFQHMLGKDGWKEGIQLKEHGSVDIDTYDFGTEALLVFLRIIHCQVTDLPETMSLELMARLAVVADYYECRDLVAYYVKRVILDNHCNTQPKRYTRTLVLWIWVAYFFRISYLFDELTTTAVREAGGTITSLGLPIPRAIMDDLNRERVKGIKIIIDALHAAKKSFLTPPFKCSMQCDSAMLGALMMQMDTHGVLSPKPQEPFVGLRHSKLMEDVGNFWCPEGLDVEHTIHYGLSKKPARRFNRHFKKVSSHLRGVQPPTFDNYLHPDWWFISGFILERYLPGCES